MVARTGLMYASGDPRSVRPYSEAAGALISRPLHCSRPHVDLDPIIFPRQVPGPGDQHGRSAVRPDHDAHFHARRRDHDPGRRPRRRPPAPDRHDRLQRRVGRHRRCLLHAGAVVRARTPPARRAVRSLRNEGRRRRGPGRRRTGRRHREGDDTRGAASALRPHRPAGPLGRDGPEPASRAPT